MKSAVHKKSREIAVLGTDILPIPFIEFLERL